jgi:hypothetical protein
MDGRSSKRGRRGRWLHGGLVRQAEFALALKPAQRPTGTSGGLLASRAQSVSPPAPGTGRTRCRGAVPSSAGVVFCFRPSSFASRGRARIVYSFASVNVGKVAVEMVRDRAELGIYGDLAGWLRAASRVQVGVGERRLRVDRAISGRLESRDIYCGPSRISLRRVDCRLDSLMVMVAGCGPLFFDRGNASDLGSAAVAASSGSTGAVRQSTSRWYVVGSH